MSSPAISVVVPTFNRPDLLDRCLAALQAQQFPPNEFEVIVVDDAAHPLTRRQVERWAVTFPAALHYLPAGPAHGPAAARNLGWRSARGVIVAFTDDDCCPEPGWLAAAAAGFTPDLAAAWGRLKMPIPAVPTDFQANENNLERAEFVTANCFCRREALQAVGGFDERFALPWREDSDLYFTLLEAGLTVRHLPEARVLHPCRSAPWGISLRQQRKSMFNALLYKKHPDLYRTKIQARPPSSYYAIVFSLILSLAALALGWLTLGEAALVLWLILTLEFADRRLRHTSHSPRHVLEMLVTSALIPPLAVFWRVYGAIRFRVLFF